MKFGKNIENEKGFTLIEITAVIIIMGFLVSAAVHKFFNIQEDAKKAALNGALSEGAEIFTQAYARFVLDNKRGPTSIVELTTDSYLGADGAKNQGGHSIGDFKIEWRAHPVRTDIIFIYVTEAKTIADLAGLDDYREAKIDGLTWYTL